MVERPANCSNEHSVGRGARSLACLLVCAMCAAGCGPQEVRSYRIPKERSPQMPAPDLPAGHPDLGPEVSPTRLTWKLPAGWEELPAGQMRVASFRVAGLDSQLADVSVIPLPGRAGGDLSNVNRWRGQVGLGPVSEDDLHNIAQGVEFGGRPAALYDQEGQNSAGEPSRILAVIQHRDGVAWFIKMTGDRQLVEQQKPAFMEFMKSAEFVSAAAAALPISGAGASLPPGHPDITTLPEGTSAPAAGEGRPEWSVPSDWEEAPAGQFLIAKFTIRREDESPATVNVSVSAGDGGGVAANVNRWRAQLGLNELTPSELSKVVKSVETAAGPAQLVEMSGQDARSGQPTALVAVTVPQSGQTWFYKLMGNATVVAAQRQAFIQFVQEAKY